MHDLPAVQRIRELSKRPRPGVALQVVASLLWIAQAAAMALAVQRIADGRGVRDIAWLAVAVLAVGLVRAWCEAEGAHRMFAEARAALGELRAQAAQALASRSPLDRTRAASGQAASLLGEQAELIMPFLLRYQPARWRVMLVPPLILVAVAAHSWVAALVLLLAAPLIPLFMAFVGWRAQAASEAQLLEQGGMNAFLLDRLRGLATLRGLGAVSASALRLRASAQALRQRTMSVLRIAFLSSAVLELFSALGVAMVAVYVGFHLLGQLEFGAWGERLSLGQGLFVLMLAPAFFEPLRELSAAWHDRAAGEAALKAMRPLTVPGLDLPGAMSSGQGTCGEASMCDGPPAVKMRALQLQMGNGPRLHVGADFELDVAPGERIALFGPSGSGKSTLLALLSGQLPLLAGQIEVGGVALREATVQVIRKRIGWMGQRPHVFAGSVQANLSPGDQPPADAVVSHALRFAALDEVAQAHPAAAVGEGGAGLSGGELARLALARLAVRARAADLLLVDEPTAHLDGETAERVRLGLLELAAGRTLIVATHDPLLAARMDRVIHLQPEARELAQACA
ncbi:thiol reductant ABC exporter subunit CydD [Variovorax dokdonensis]|uniref:Thiol reductant ABC exporter subunit CydD n=1 Tax=Variovorax dokdonensis TaxID=344883 RepID=A0ABT7NDS6_9BURK|nr:thiol reductant ABC exporter subunit CydD [Variovorax dokdonensis]MDM0046111.1 thiol reductant ABC exporter subunit CydD [Variovorax dokdonensis]